MENRAEIATRAATVGAETANSYFGADLEVSTKSDKTDVVTRADHEAQATAVDEIRSAFEGERIVAEEEGVQTTLSSDGPNWIVDPIDGTNNFVRGVPLWTTSVACVIDGEPVAASTVAPTTDDAFVADDTTTTYDEAAASVSDVSDPQRCDVVPTLWWDYDSRDEYATVCEAITSRFGDLKRYGSTQLELALLASGAVDGVVSNNRGNPWDTVAGVHLVRCAGGVVTDTDGDHWRHDSDGLVASNGSVHDLLLETVQF
ncbi:inositol monophosphatase [Natrarchaeobius sp. A-rgal3]|uniref:inositol monophosphatase family protein n=1 Tax=Natrarchaeobius versutus TaxID=1679078 RepID=UPI00350F4C12